MPQHGERSETATAPATQPARKGRDLGAAQSNGAEKQGGALQILTDLDYLRGLIEAVDQSGIDTLEIHRAGTRIRISKNAITNAPAAAIISPAATATVDPPAGDASAGTAIPSAEAPPPPAHYQEVTSPMVGTFYRAPAPEAPPYVELGSPVHEGQTLCILEAMKLMNELDSEFEGVVREILVENGDPVEYGQVLFRIEPTGSGS